MAHSLAQQLKKMGHEILVLTTGEEFKEYSMESIRVYAFPFVQSLLHNDLANLKKILMTIEGLIDAFAPDIVNIHGWIEVFSFYQIRILRKKKVPYCITVHGLLEQKHYNTDACVNLWKRAGSVNTVSRAILESLHEQNIAHPSLRVIYNGLPASPKPAAPLPHPPSLAMIGRLTEEKNFDVAFHAMKILVKANPSLKLVLVGGGIQYRDLTRLRKSLGLDEAIKMTDFVRPSHVPNYINQASIVLVPSSYESFCLTALEAAFLSRPVVASNVLGLKEVIEPFQTGLLIEPGNPSALAEAVERLLSNPSQIEKMGKAAQERALEFFTIEKSAQNYLNMYREVLYERSSHQRDYSYL